MDPMERLHIRSSEFESTMKRGLSELREDEEFFDVTLACGAKQMKAHKVILSACSPFFRWLIKSIPHQHPFIYLRGVQFCHLESLLCFMYNGEVNVAYKDLSGLMAVANELQVIGLIKSVAKPQGKDNTTGVDITSKQVELALEGIPGPSAIAPKQPSVLESKKNDQAVTIKQESEHFLSDNEMEEDSIENEFECSAESQMVDPPENERSGFDFSVSPDIPLNHIKEMDEYLDQTEGANDSASVLQDVNSSSVSQSLCEDVPAQKLIPFIKRLDPRLVPNPLEGVEGPRPGMEPYWFNSDGTVQFFDPVVGKPIAFWDFYFGKAWFLGNGYLNIDPENGSKFKFYFDPTIDPYSKPKENDQPLSRNKKGPVYDLADSFSLEKAHMNAPYVVKQIIKHASLQPEGFPHKESNQKVLIKWLCDVYFDAFEERFGFKTDTLNLSLWPGRYEARAVLNKLELLANGLTKRIDKETGETVPTELEEKLFKKFDNCCTAKKHALMKELRENGLDSVLPSSRKRKLTGHIPSKKTKT